MRRLNTKILEKSLLSTLNSAARHAVSDYLYEGLIDRILPIKMYIELETECAKTENKEPTRVPGL